MRKLFILFTFLCVSVVGFATDYCHSEMTAGGKTIYLTCQQISAGNYQLKVECNEAMSGLGGSFCEVNGVGGYQLNAAGHFDLSADGKTITCDIASSTAPRVYTPLYVLIDGEKNFGDVSDASWAECAGGGGGGGSTPEGEIFVPANASLNSTYIAPGWVEDAASEATFTYNSTTGVISGTILNTLNEKWQGQIKFNHGVTFSADKYYDFSIKLHATKGIGGVTIKVDDNNGMLLEDASVVLPADLDYVYTKTDVAGVAGGNGIMVFDFGWAPANTDITISEISIIEKDAPSTPLDPNSYSAGGHIIHLDAYYVDIDGTNKTYTLDITSDDDMDGLSNSYWSLSSGNALVKTNMTVSSDKKKITCTALSSTNPNIYTPLYVLMPGEVNFGTVSLNWEDRTPLSSEYCGYEGAELQKDGHYIKMTIETQENGDVVFTLASGTNSGACSYRNGGFEGGNNGLDNFVVSDDDFVTETPASNYFTVTRPSDGDLEYVLTKKADLPVNAKIKHLSAGAIAWREDGVDRWSNPEIVYTYGSICTEEPELSSIVLSASTTIGQVGSDVTITANPLSQFGTPIEATINYSFSPADAGSMSGNVFTFAKTGAVTITASSGLIAESITLYGVSSQNLALNKTCEGGYYDGNPGEAYAKVNDGADNTAWVTYADQSTSKEWWYVDLGVLYNITAISALWGQDYSTNYILQVRSDAPEEGDKADDEAWTTIATVTNASANNIAVNYVTAVGRFVRIHSLNRSGNCIRLRELQIFGSEAATPTKEVSALVNDEAMGTATVKQNDKDVTAVETGSIVTFSAVANEGYIFVNWSNDETRATFDAEVNETMNLTANFRVLGNIYCNTEVTSTRDDDVHTAYATFKRTSANNYALVVRSTETLGNFTNTELIINGTITNLNNKGTLSNENHVLTYEFTSSTTPSMNTPYLYLNVPGSKYTECWFTKLTNIEFDVPCEDAVSVTSITLSQNSANLLVGKTLTLTPSFTPAYATDRALTWETSNASVATVAGGVVTAGTAGTATITAKLTSDNSIYATCAITVVDALTEATWHGYAIATTPTEGNILLTYSVTRDVDQHLTFSLTTDKDLLGFVAFINIAGVAHEVTGYGANHTATYTTEDIYEDNVSLNCMWDVRGSGYGQNFYFTYMTGSENQEPNVMAVDESQDNTSALTAHDNEIMAVVIVNRSFVAGNLYTLVLPFDVDAEKTAEKLPGKLTKLNNTYVKENKDLRINFVDVDAIEAGVPYLYSPSANVKNAVFENVTVSKDLNPTRPADGLAEYHGIYAPTTGSALKDIPKAYVLGSDQYLYDVQTLNDDQQMKALRGYFVLDFPAQVPGVRARVVFNNQETEVATDIDHVESKVECSKVLKDGVLYIIRDGKAYNAQGQLIK